MIKNTVFFRIISKSLSTIVRSGFSLIELLVVVAIIGILAAIGSVGYSRYIESARNAAIIAIAKQISDALQACDINNSCKDYVPSGGNPQNIVDVLLGDGSGTNGLIASLGSKNPWDNTPINGPTVQLGSGTPPFSGPLNLSPFIGNIDGSTVGAYTFCGGLGHIYINTGNYPSSSGGSLPPNGIQIAACTDSGLQGGSFGAGSGTGDVSSPAPFSLINIILGS